MSRNPLLHINSSATSLLSDGRPSISSIPARRPSASSSEASSPRTPVTPSWSDDGYPASLSRKYSLSPSPASWGMPLLMNNQEPDDSLHNPDPRRDRKSDAGGSIFTLRGLGNLGCLAVLCLGTMMLFAGYPVISHFTTHKLDNQGGFNLGGINATGQIPDLPGNYGLVDKDTSLADHTIKSYHDDEELVLVFSDEFNADGRTFYPGDDPFWEGVNLHYWGTDDKEWYDPDQATTKDGYLHLRLDKVDDVIDNHNMTYKSGMIQSWNKFCFTGGLLIASVQLPGSSEVSGLWPAIWTMGNLGRAGYGASVEGLWPYSYDSCDVGTLPNQTYPDFTTPIAATEGGDPKANGYLSYLSGQRLSACTCPGESHPGPMRDDGTYVGRAAPEIDALEATVTDGIGHVSLSAQFAPFNAKYKIVHNNKTTVFDDPERTALNSYQGSRFQQTASGLGLTNPDCYERPGKCFALYGFEYQPGFDNAYITWINEVRAWTLNSAAMVADSSVEISRRLMPMEPMYLIANLGISESFGEIDTTNLIFPSTMLVDYIRVYQRKDQINVGCSPEEFPTESYITTYQDAYTNPNLTVWSQYGQPWPKNKLSATGCN